MNNYNLTPLQQLNLFIHMSLDYPDNSLFYPYLQRKGLKIKIIGEKLRVPPLVRKRFKEKYNAKINEIVEPEIIFENENNGDIILLECKTSAFSNELEDRGAKQALGYLSLENHALRQYLGLDSSPNKKNDLRILYSTNENFIQELDNVLEELNQKLSSITSNLEYEIMGIKITETGIYIQINEGGEDKKVEISKVNPGKINGSVMYIIPLDPGINFKDEYGMKVIEGKLKNALLISIGRMAGLKRIEFTVSALCKRMIPVWDIWSSDAKKKVKKLVVILIKQIISEMKKKKLNIDFDGEYITVEKCDRNMADRLRTYLKSIQFNADDVRDTNEQINMEEFIGYT